MNKQPASKVSGNRPAWIGFAGVVLAALISAGLGYLRPAIAKTPIQYSGRVTDRNGHAIVGALVLAVADQSTPESFRTDVYGVFQIHLPPETRSLELFVSSSGYVSVQLQANIHRDGIEQIELQRVLNSPGTEPAPPMPHHARTLDATDATRQPPGGKVIQTCEQGSTCVAGENNHVQVEQSFGPRPIRFTPDQLSAITQAVHPFAGSAIELRYEYGTSEEASSINSLKAALEAGGAQVKSSPAMMVFMENNQKLVNGVTFCFSEDRSNEAQSIATALNGAGFLPAGAKFDGIRLPPSKSGILVIYVGHSL